MSTVMFSQVTYDKMMKETPEADHSFGRQREAAGQWFSGTFNHQTFGKEGSHHCSGRENTMHMN